MIIKVSRFKGTCGAWKEGRPPEIDPKSPTVFVSILKKKTNN